MHALPLDLVVQFRAGHDPLTKGFELIETWVVGWFPEVFRILVEPHVKSQPQRLAVLLPHLLSDPRLRGRRRRGT